MNNFAIHLKAEPRTGGLYLLHPVLITLEGNIKGLFVDGHKVTDVFFNHIQLRLYIGETHKENEKRARINESCDHYLIFSNNENDHHLSFDELNETIKNNR